MTTPADQAIQFALAQVGKPYRWGATGPDAFDCSGLVQAAYKAAGVSLPRTTFGMITVGQNIGKSNLAPGDLVFPDAGHVQIYLGNGQIVESPHTGANVRVAPMWGFWSARRVTSPGTGVNSAGGIPNATTAGNAAAGCLPGLLIMPFTIASYYIKEGWDAVHSGS